MEQELLTALNGFDAVWQRVLSGKEGGPGAPEQAPAEAGPLDMAMSLWETYRTFTRQVRGEAGARFAALAEETRSLVRSLQTEHFLRTGDLYSPVGAQTLPVFGVLTGMRRAHEEEQRLASQLQDTALADLADRHAGILRDMIAGLLEK